MKFCAVLLVALLVAPAMASSPTAAVLAAHKDASTIPQKDRYYMRYLWWPKGWDHPYLLTRSQQALLSLKKVLPVPIYVGASTWRIDMRQAAHDVRLRVWEEFAKIDPFFHSNWEFLEDGVITVYFPSGNYDGTEYGPTVAEVKVKKGDLVPRPSLLNNPLVEVEDGKFVKAQDDLRRLLNTEVPILMGPHWMINVSRQIGIDNLDNKVGYYNWFGIKNRNDFFGVVGVDEDFVRKRYLEWRAHIKKSGISEQERLVGMYRAPTGRVWFTLDTKTQRGRGDPGRNLLPGELEHDAEEWIGVLPWGGPINSLNQAKDNAQLKTKAGDAQATAPDFIGGNKAAISEGLTNDPRIHTDSCWDCHGYRKDYLMPFTDKIREQIKSNKALVVDPYNKSISLFDSLYNTDDLYEELDLARADFSRAIARLTRTKEGDPGLTVAGFTRIYREAYYQYINPKDGITLEIAANELGVTPKQLVDGLRKYNRERGASDWILSEFMDSTPKSIRRISWENSYQYAGVLALGIQPPEIFNRVKRKPK